MDKLKPERNASLISNLFNRMMAVRDAEFLIHLPADFWEEAVQEMTYHSALSPLAVKIIASKPNVCQFELRYCPAQVNNKPVGLAILRGSISYDSAFDSGYVELTSRLQPLRIMGLNLLAAGFLLFFLVIVGFIFRGGFDPGFIAWTLTLAYILTVSTTLRYLWDKPALLIEIARDKLENANVSIIQPEFRKKKK